MSPFIRVSSDWGYTNINAACIHNFIFEKWLEFRPNTKPNIPKSRRKISNTVITRPHMPKACEIIHSPPWGRKVEGSLGFNTGLHWWSALLTSSIFGQIFLLLGHLKETVGIITARVGRQIKSSFLSLLFRSFFLLSFSFLPSFLPPFLFQSSLVYLVYILGFI